MNSLSTLRGIRARRGGAAVGCLIALAVVVVIVIIGVVVVMLNWRGWASSAVETQLVAAIESTDLSDAEKGEVIAEVKAVTHAFKEGDVSMEELAAIGENLAESPVFPAGVVYGLRKGYLDPSGLSEEEKAAGAVAFGRVATGLQAKTMDKDAVQRVFEPISTTSTTGSGVHINSPHLQLHLKAPEQVTDEELREVIALAQTEADAAGVTPEPEPFDASDEIAKAIREALGRDLPKVEP